jgi:hypothetical protein
MQMLSVTLTLLIRTCSLDSDARKAKLEFKPG